MKKFFQKKHVVRNFKKGFTLVETLVAISILSISIAAAFTAVQGGLQSSTIAKDQITAFYLAQEAMELIRNRRDENALYSINGVSRDWLNGMADPGNPCAFGNTCRVDSTTATFTYCGAAFGTCANIGQDTVSGRYGYSWTAINFKREIQFQSISSEEVKVIIKITWVSRGITRSFLINESLFDHQ